MKLDRITSNPKRMNGQPCIRNLRLTVRRVIELLATYPDSFACAKGDREELYQEFPELEDEDIQQALFFASTDLEKLQKQKSGLIYDLLTGKVQVNIEETA
jgi:uncharacterized protein (DUF433 family)